MITCRANHYTPWIILPLEIGPILSYKM